MIEETSLIPIPFLRYASDILADTHRGLSGTKIIEATSSYAVEFEVEIPHTQMSIAVPNKRTALFENLKAFSAQQQFKIIKDLCSHRSFALKKYPEKKELEIRLITRYGHLNDESLPQEINEQLVEETKHWLEGYDGALSLNNQALEKYENRVFLRNLLDDLRLSLESLLHDLFGNEKSLENQKNEVGKQIKSEGGSAQLSNMFVTLVSYYCQYQNDYVKHNDAVKEEEIEFIVEITSSFMKHLIRIKQK